MKVILLRDVARIGRRYDIKDVPSGHALNFLIPQKLAQIATPENVKRVQEQKHKNEQSRATSEQQFADALLRCETTPITIAAPANEHGHLFQGIHAADIASHALKAGINLTPEVIDLPHPLKALGTHTVTLIQGAQKGSCTVTIVGEK